MEYDLTCVLKDLSHCCIEHRLPEGKGGSMLSSCGTTEETGKQGIVMVL
jgi:hypothetical protein